MQQPEPNESRRHQLQRALLQGSLVAICVLLSFLLTALTHNGLLIGSFVASAFTVFAFPYAERSRPRYLMGGYVCGITCGLIGYMLKVLLSGTMSVLMADILFATLAVFLSTVFMLLLKLEHPAAASLSLCVVIDSHPLFVSALAMSCILVLSATKGALVYICRGKLEGVE